VYQAIFLDLRKLGLVHCITHIGMIPVKKGELLALMATIR